MIDVLDVLIIGCGIAGLITARHLPKTMSVALLCKTEKFASNTYWAQGGIACSKDENDVALHIKDTLDAGAGLCDEKAVRLLCEGSREAIDSLIKSGMQFDTDESGHLLYTKEAAHSTNRIIHADGDATGRKLEEFLLSTNSRPIYENHRVIDLLIEGGICYGVTVRCGDEIKNIYAKTVVLASGGVGSLYQYSTNDSCISGDIHGIAASKGLPLRDMQMMQFHPTVYSDNKFARKVLLTEALRGEGAYVVNSEGERFLFDTDKRGELAPRDIVSRAIIAQAAKTQKPIYLSFENFTPQFFHERFPNIYHNMQTLGFELPQERVPIYPAFHYAIGGIECDLNGLVKGCKNIYAVGEVANNRLHGANRLASNSLLEGLVFGKIVADAIAQNCFEPHRKEFAVTDEPLVKEGDEAIRNSLRELMWLDAGVVRTKEGLQEALHSIDSMLSQEPGRLARLRLLAARSIVIAAIDAPSLGAHYILQTPPKRQP